VARKTLTKFDMEKDEWYYQPKIYIDRQDADSTYRELKEFRLSMNQGAEEELVEDNMLSEFSKEEEESPAKKLSRPPAEQNSQKSLNKTLKAGKQDGFFDGKANLLKEEIEDINRNLDKREKIEKESGYSIDFEIKEVKRHLHEIYTWKKGDKSTIEFIRMEFLKQLASLYREKRMNGLSFWKDSVFEKRDRRNLVFEYKELTWMDGLAFENSKQRKVRT
jgi:hypothetical protein